LTNATACMGFTVIRVKNPVTIQPMGLFARGTALAVHIRVANVIHFFKERRAMVA
tara:strand:- start:512 stop:676 length:165 start_codon:yes stop_codon:yes gene_type:complete